MERVLIKPFPRSPCLCVVRTLKEYIKRTDELRQSRQLIVITRSPFTAVKRDTVSTWVKQVLNEAGIEKYFGAHSLRGAGVSKGALLGLDVDCLMKYGSWKNERTMAKHYRKPIRNDNEETLGQQLLDAHVDEMEF